jgi:hypothetical protein
LKNTFERKEGTTAERRNDMEFEKILDELKTCKDSIIAVAAAERRNDSGKKERYGV